MREHIRKVIEKTQRPGDPLEFNGPRDPMARLAAETIRLAQIAASMHMVLSVRGLEEGVDPKRLSIRSVPLHHPFKQGVGR